MAPRTALITGASSGIGEAFARRLAADGHRVVLVARRRERLEALARELVAAGGRAQPLVADLATDAGLRAVEAHVASDEDLAVLVNNAGVAHFGRFVDEDPQEAEDALRVMVLATVRLTRAALPRMCARRAGAAINMASRSAFAPQPNHATYAAAKAYIHRFTLAVAEELRGSGVRMVSVCPGPVRTEIFQRAGIDPRALSHIIEPKAVVDAALATLAAGSVVCVPDERRAVAMLRRVLPSRWLRRASTTLDRLAKL